jgi:SAM-dependent methyltransferase
MRLVRAARRRVARRLPPRRWRPYVVPFAPSVHEARGRLRIARAPVLTGTEHAARSGLRDIEEVIGCSLCGDERMQPLLTPEGRNGRWRYHVVRCPSCGFLYRHPGIRPERLGELYEGRYDRFLTGRYARARQLRYAAAMDAFGDLFAEGGGRRLLDFGCGAGLFMELADQRGFEAWGVDLSESSIERARARPGGERAHFGAPADVPEIAAGGFDVITLWSVMAHLPTPLDDLRMLRRLLAPGGAILIMTVNANSLRMKASGARWNGFTPNHLKFFAPGTLCRALAATGFERPALPPVYSFEVERGRAPLSDRQTRRLRRVTDRGNRGNMIRAVAYAARSKAGA